MRREASLITNSNVKKLGAVCKIINGAFLPKSVLQLNANQVPYAKATDIVADHLTSTKASVLNKLIQKRNAEIANKGAFLIVLTGASIGQIATLDIDAPVNTIKKAPLFAISAFLFCISLFRDRKSVV